MLTSRDITILKACEALAPDGVDHALLCVALYIGRTELQREPQVIAEQITSIESAIMDYYNEGADMDDGDDDA